jgi:hypothetical protein
VFRGGRGIDDAGSLPFDPRAMARAIPGAHLLEDPGGVESIRFGATTSGQVVAYDPTGRLVFTGGLTASRGHEGESDGARLLETRLRESPSTVAEIRRAVFGCGLFSSTEKDR